MLHRVSLVRKVATASVCSVAAFGLGYNVATSNVQASPSIDIAQTIPLHILAQLNAEQQSKLRARPSFTTNSAVAILGPSPADNKDSGVRGCVDFFEPKVSGGPITVRASITGLKPNSKHGFHIHTLGDLTKGCMSAGGHWNPFDAPHGAQHQLQHRSNRLRCFANFKTGGPSDASSVRHAGDLGNLQSDGSGNCNVEFQDSLLTLHGPLSIIGRSVIMYATPASAPDLCFSSFVTAVLFYQSCR
jgi:Cu-Zn family superoxide dismutase